MKKVAIVGCGAYMDSGYGCPGEWKCLKSAALGEGKFGESTQVIAFVKCECPGRAQVSNVALAVKAGGMELDAIHMSSCLVNAKPGCPYGTAEEFAGMLEKKTGLPVVLGTHEYH